MLFKNADYCKLNLFNFASDLFFAIFAIHILSQN